MQYRLCWCSLVLVLLLLMGCQPMPPAPTPTLTAPGNFVSPAPTPALPDPGNFVSPLSEATPVAATTAEPALTGQAQGRFEFDRPVKASDTIVRGTGIPGTLIEIHDVTRMGVQLGGAAVGDDGRFEVAVGTLSLNTRLGITLAEPDDALWSNKEVLGPQAQVVPLVGLYLDTVLVEP